MTNPFWQWVVQTEDTGYTNNEAFDGPSSFDEGPCWSFDRFGQTKTQLPDGRMVYIGGEHEDSYDPDFYIYNDIVIITPDGEITIYGYPEKDFPPTDFHSATLHGKEIILIGALSYIENRDPSETQVLRLNTEDWSIKKQKTTQPPGWISKHQHTYQPTSKTIQISTPQKWTSENDLATDFSTWELNLTTWAWQCIEQKNWSQYKLSRSDGEMNNLWNIRHHLEMEAVGMSHVNVSDYLHGDDMDEEMKAQIQESLDEMAQDSKKLASNTDLSLVPNLYKPSTPHTCVELPEIDLDEEDEESYIEYNSHCIEIAGTHIKFFEESDSVIMRVEGILSNETITSILNETCKNLANLESTPYSHKQIS